MKLPAAQRRALDLLAGTLGAEAYLAGGVAVALRLHHRRSRDLAFFTDAEHPERPAEALAPIPGLRISSRAEGTLYCDLEGLPVCLIRYRYYPLLERAERLPEIPVPMASQKDLVGMKLAAIASRGAVRDVTALGPHQGRPPRLGAGALTPPRALEPAWIAAR